MPRALRPSLGAQPLRSSIATRLGFPAGTTLGDLDSHVWRNRTAEQVRLLAGEVIRAVQQGLPAQLADARLVAAGRLRIEELDLSVRAKNALHYGRLVEGGQLRPMTLGQLWRLPNFGAVSLLDVLTAVEAAEARRVDGGNGGDTTRTRSRAVRSAAEALARKRWASAITADDPRLGSQLAIRDSHARTVREAAEALADATYTPSSAKRTAALLREFTARVDGLRKLMLEDELEQVVDALTERPSARAAVVARAGLGGGEPVTLEEAGRSIGVTRERVRQLEKRFKDRVAACSGIWTPVLDKALQLAGDMVPASPSAVAAELREAGLVRADFSIASLISAAEILGKELPFTTAGENLAPLGTWAPASTVRTTARRLVEHWGATTVTDVEARLKEDGLDIEPRLLALTIEALDGFEWLDQPRGWFWFHGTRNRLLNQVLKIMSVAGSIDLAELRAGVGRDHRMKGFRPPRDVLAALCVSSGLYSREGDRIVGGPRLPDWRDVLGNNERMLVDTLFDFGPVMRRDDLERVVVAERGLNRSSFYVYLAYAPMIERYAPGVFGLRGAPVTAAEVDALIPPRVRHQVLQDDGWTDDGRPWAAFRISPAAESTGILGAPAALRAVTTGSFAIFAEDDSPVGTLVVEQNMWGLSPFFRRWGVEAGDLVVIELDLATRKAVVSVGTDELLLRYQGGE